MSEKSHPSYLQSANTNDLKRRSFSSSRLFSRSKKVGQWTIGMSTLSVK
jgi:hypothetical protein